MPGGDAAMMEVVPARCDCDDVDLLKRAAAGNQDSVGELYGRHREAAIAVATSVLTDPTEAEDVVQEAFLELPRMARSFDPARGRPAQWLYRSVRNRSIDHLRRRTRAASIAAPSVDGPDALLALAPARAASPADEAEAEEMLDMVARLEARHAHLIRLAFIEGFSHSAIAGLTGLPLGTVKTRIRLSLRLLRALMSEADITPRHDPSPLEDGRPATVFAITRDRIFARGVRAAAGGLAHVETSPALPQPVAGRRPDAVVLDLRDETELADWVDRLDDLGWDKVPVVMHVDERGQAKPPARGAPTLVTGAAYGACLGLDAALPAVLSASADPMVHHSATHRLIRLDAGPFVAGDSLGRVTGATASAALLFGRTPRQLQGAYVRDLSAMPTAWTERQWQGLAATGWWTGAGLARRWAGQPTRVQASAWMTPGGSGFVALAVPEPI